MDNLKKYYLVDIGLKPGCAEEFRRRWAKDVDDIIGAEHIGTFTVLAGDGVPGHVQSLFRFSDFNAWARAGMQSCAEDRHGDLVESSDLTLLALEPYGDFESIFKPGVSENPGVETFYFWADVEIKANRQVEYHERWKRQGPRTHSEKGADYVGTFQVVSGKDTTVHAKRLFIVSDPVRWIMGEGIIRHSNYWEYLAWSVTTTLVAPEPYSHIR